ncbi:MAG: AsmA-like C-terminal region-containing protein [Ginsengibacter sp.]
MKKNLKLLLKIVVAFIGLILIIYFILLGYVATHKKYLISKLSEEMSKRINGNVKLQSIDVGVFNSFPNISLVIRDLSISDSMVAVHHHTFFKAKKLFVSMAFSSLVKGQFQLKGITSEDGTIDIFTDSSGYSNDYLLKPHQDNNIKSKPSENSSVLSFLKLKNFRFIIDDKRKDKLYDIAAKKLVLKFSDQDSIIRINTDADLFIHSLAFNLERGSFLKEKSFVGDFTLLFHKIKKQLTGDKNKVEIDNQPFIISSRFDLQGPNPEFYMSVETKKLTYNLGKSLLPVKIAQSLSIVNVDEPVDVSAIIDGPLKGGDPKINVQWQVGKTDLITPFTSFTSASFNGSFTNHVNDSLPRKDPNSKIIITDFSAEWNGISVSSKVMEINNLSEPILSADLQSNFGLEKLNELLGSQAISLTSGKASALLTYKGPLLNNNQHNSLLNGEINFNDGNILYTPRNVNLKNVNGKLLFNNSKVQVSNLRCDVLDNKIIMNGSADNLISLLNTEPNKAIINWNIYSPKLNLASFIYLLKNRNATSRKSSGKNKLGKISAQIDDLLDRGSINLDIKADNVIYRKLNASNFSAHVALYPESYQVKNVIMYINGGSINLNGILSNKANNQHAGNFSAAMKNIDINKIFKAFNNFGQDGIVADNLSGKLDATVKGALIINDEGKAYPNSITSQVDFSLKNGALINFSPIQKIQEFIFKKRNFSDIKFAELKNKLEIANENIKINRMEIASSVIRVYVEGIYSLKGNTDLSIQIPLNNLKKLDSNYIPVNKGVSKKMGSSIFLRGRPGADGNVDFKLDLFNKFHKENKEKS